MISGATGSGESWSGNVRSALSQEAAIHPFTGPVSFRTRTSTPYEKPSPARMSSRGSLGLSALFVVTTPSNDRTYVSNDQNQSTSR